jgi:hypothetical protein
MKKSLTVLAVAILAQVQTVNAVERNNHFSSLESSDVQSALCNIQAYNEKITTITSKPKLTALDMVKIHELTYTLENAVKFLKVSIENASEQLEEVHLASETLDAKIIKESTAKYLAITSLLLSKKQC